MLLLVMAIYRFEVKAVSRRKGQSAVAAAAYRSAERLHDERTDQTHDYSRRSGVLHTEILTPARGPESLHDRQTLWNAAETAERRKDAKVAREITLALPHELDHQQQQQAARHFAQYLVDRYGVAVDLAMHAPDREGDQRNFHVHLLMTTREIDQDGLARKTRQLDVRDTASIEVEHLRSTWAGFANRSLERAGISERVDHRSLERQGLNREPEPKLGPVASQMERDGRRSHAGDDIRSVHERNRQREDLQQQQNVIDLEIERERRRLEEARREQPAKPRNLRELLEDRQADDVARFYEEAEETRDRLTQHLEQTYGDREADLEHQAQDLEEVFTTKNRVQIFLSQLTGNLSWNARQELENTHAQLDYISQQRDTALDDLERDRETRLHDLLDRHQGEQHNQVEPDRAEIPLPEPPSAGRSR